MGVSGVGKTTVGRAVAEHLGADFEDADDFHPPQNVAKMSRGEPLDDSDRAGWLDRLNALLLERCGRGRSTVLACSALKNAYRHRLTAGLHCRVCLLYLKADAEAIRERITARRGHFMPPSLLQSQFEALEEPAEARVIDASRPLAQVLASARDAVGAAQR